MISFPRPSAKQVGIFLQKGGVVSIVAMVLASLIYLIAQTPTVSPESYKVSLLKYETCMSLLELMNGGYPPLISQGGIELPCTLPHRPWYDFIDPVHIIVMFAVATVLYFFGLSLEQKAEAAEAKK